MEQASKIFVLRDADVSNSFSVVPSAGANTLAMMTRRAGNDLYAIVVNESTEDVQASLTVPPAFANATLHVLFEDRKIQVKQGKFDDQFKPYEVHVYATPDHLP